jgi:folate-binding protein YgfZ
VSDDVRDVWAVWLPRDVVRVAGPDAESFLQGQLSQDVAGLAAGGGSAWSFLLQPQGKVDAFLRVTKQADDEFILDVDAGWGEAVMARLNRFKLRVKADIDARPDWRCLAIRGPRAHEVAPPDTGTTADWPGLPGVDLLGPDPTVPDGVPLASIEDYERARIAAGVPVMGKELDEHTIPAESGVVDRAVSFTKGCYTGQELVARIDSRGGNVPRRLRALVVVDGSTLPTGAAIDVDGKDRGRVTSAAPGMALAYVHRDVEPPADATVAGTAVRITTLP